MRKLLIPLLFFLSLAAIRATDYTRLVNPLMGTLSSYEFSAGNTYPAIARPWGMNFWTPQTGKNGDGWQYTYTARQIRGFKQTHQPSPWIGDYGQFSLMPVVGGPVYDEQRRASWFSHKAEEALPYYYKVYLADYDVQVELTPTERACLFRFTFPQTEAAYVVVDAYDRGSHLRILPEQRRIEGYTTRNSGGVPDNFRNYFVIEFDKDFTYRATVGDGPLTTDTLQQTAEHALGVVGFHTRRGEQVHARVASSFISLEQAERNLQELGADSFETLVAKGRDAWNAVLGRIAIEGGTEEQQRTFYSCLYRSLLFPRAFYEKDANGRIVLETDSPYMAPVPFRGKRNESAFVVEVLKTLAKAYNVSEEEFAKQTNETVEKVFHIE